MQCYVKISGEENNQGYHGTVHEVQYSTIFTIMVLEMYYMVALIESLSQKEDTILHSMLPDSPMKMC